jgi:hypothetical protein
VLTDVKGNESDYRFNRSRLVRPIGAHGKGLAEPVGGSDGEHDWGEAVSEAPVLILGIDGAHDDVLTHPNIEATAESIRKVGSGSPFRIVLHFLDDKIAESDKCFAIYAEAAAGID